MKPLSQSRYLTEPLPHDSLVLFHNTSLYFVCLVTKLHLTFFATSWTVASQAPLSMGFPRQEYWSGLSFPSPGDLPNPGIEPRSPALEADALTSEPCDPMDCSKPGFPVLHYFREFAQTHVH